MAEIVLVRHGQTEWSAAGRHTSYTDLPLTAEGERQARQLTAALAARRFAAVLCSPRRRARDTAALAGLTVTELCEDLAEWNYGEYEGITTAEVYQRRPGWDLWRDGCPGGETPGQVAQRLDRVLARAREILATGTGDVALVAHGHTLRMAGARWVDLAPGDGGRLALATGTVGALGYEHDRPVIQQWNAPTEWTSATR